MNKRFFKLIIVFFILIFTPISVYADDEIEDEYTTSEFLECIEVSNNLNNDLQINAIHAIILDRSSKQIIYGKNENEICKMASTTKIMTAIIVLENCSLEDIVTISSKAAGTGGSRLGLSTNDQISVENLLYGLMMRSGNDAAVALAEHISGNIEQFSTLMNNKAIELNLSSTHFVTPHGLDSDDHFTTAYDLALLTDYALQNAIFKQIVGTKTYTITINGYSKLLSNTNELLGNIDGVYGVKTGFTNGANRCLVSACKRGDLDIICVVLGCDTKKNRTQDSIKLINYAFDNYRIINIEDFIDKNFEEWYLLHTNSFTVNKGRSQILHLYLDKLNLPYTHMAINTSDIDNITASINFTSYYEAPIYSNTPIGTLILKINDTEYFSINILNSNNILKRNIYDYLYILISNYCNYLSNVF